MDILEMLKEKELLEFSQNLPIQRNYMGDRLFPDVKTENLEAEYMRLSNGANLPYAAVVHGFDTEANLGERRVAERVTVEKLLIKEKINLSERQRLLLDHGVKQNAILNYLFDDMGNMAESVKTRTEVMKMEALQTGKITIDENKVKIQVDYGVPSGNKVNSANSWADPTSDIMGEIQAWLDKAADQGQTINRGVTSTKIMRYMQQNEGIQKLIHGVNGTGVFTSPAQVNALLSATFSGLTFSVNDQRYVPYLETKKKSPAPKRFFAESNLSLFSANNDGSFGVGLWGVTPEEEIAGPFTEKNQSQFITLTAWKTPDPVATWTKASGVFIPVIPNPYGLICATINTTAA